MTQTFLLVDGENIDTTLGVSLLGRRPAPEERPRWDRVLSYAQAIWDQPARGLFFLNATSQVPLSFVQALTTLGYRPVLLSGPSDVKIVDVAIQRTLEAMVEREGGGDALLASHDSDFAPQLAGLLRRRGPPGGRDLLQRAGQQHARGSALGRAGDLRSRGRRRRVHGHAAAHARDPDRALRSVDPAGLVSASPER